MTDTIAWRAVTLGEGTVYPVESLVGWEELPAASVQDIPVAGGAGSMVTPISIGARIVQAEGWCEAGSTRDAVLTALRQQMAPLPGSRVTESLTVSHAGLSLTANARLLRFSANPEAGWASGYFSWAAQWLCSDPLRYGGWQSGSVSLPVPGAGIAAPLTAPITIPANPTGGTFTVNNTGNAPAPAVYILRGPITNPGMMLNGSTSMQRQVWYDLVLESGDSLMISTPLGAAFLDGAYRAPVIGSARTKQLELQPGVNTVSALGQASPGAAMISVTFRPAYW